MKRQKGAIIILVLWVLAFLTMITGFYAAQARIRRNLGQQAWDLLASRYLVHSILSIVSTRLAPVGIKPDEAWDKGLFIPDGTQYTVTIGGKEASFSLDDEHGKLDLNNATEEQLKKVIGGLLGRGQQTNEIVDGILDWRSAGNVPRESGAKDDVYLSRSPPYLPADAPFHTLEELLLVNGVTQELFYGPIRMDVKGAKTGNVVWQGGLRDIFTVYNKSGTVIKDYAPAPVKDFLDTGVGGKGISHEVLCLKLKAGGITYWVYWKTLLGSKSFEIVHWVETAGMNGDEEGVGEDANQ